MPDFTLPCFVCQSALVNVLESDTRYRLVRVNQPQGGLTFRSYGHYGSRFFDPLGNLTHTESGQSAEFTEPDEPDYVEINICDKCLKAREENFPRMFLYGQAEVTTLQEWNS